MMTTLRGTVMTTITPFAFLGCRDAARRCAHRGVEDLLELGEIANLVGRRRDAVGQRLRRAVDPRDGHADVLRADHGNIRAIADEQRLRWPDAELRQRDVEDL